MKKITAILLASLWYVVPTIINIFWKAMIFPERRSSELKAWVNTL